MKLFHSCRLLFTVSALSAGLLCPALVRGESISYSGNLRSDATVVSCGAGCTLVAGDSDGDYAQFAAVVRTFTVSQTSDVQAVTFSYGGGVNGKGAAIAEGGFAPYLSLFDGAGSFLSSTYFGMTCPAGAKTNSTSGQCNDVRLDAGTLAPGTYEIALSAYSNLSYAENYGAGTLADGFTGLGNLFAGEDLHYAFDVDLKPTTTPPPPPAVTPEPASILLVGPALGMGSWLVGWKRRKVRHSGR